VIAGPERKSRLISEEEKLIVAYHEAGHAVVMNTLPEADTGHKISIISRGMAGGYTLALPEEDRILTGRKNLVAEMVSLWAAALPNKSSSTITPPARPTILNGLPKSPARWSPAWV